MKFIKQTAWYGSAVAIAAIMAVALLFAGPAEKASAAATIADIDATIALTTNATTGTGTFTTLGSLVITVGVDNDINPTSDITLTLTGNWEFDTAAGFTAGPPLVTITVPDGDGITAVANPVRASATSITLDVTGIGDVGDVVTITNIKVRPTDTTADDDVLTVDVEGGADPTVALTALPDSGFTAGLTATTAVASSLVNVIAFIGNDAADSIFQTDAGVFAANGATTLVCGDGTASCDIDGVVDQVTVRLIGPASGDANITVFAGDNATSDAIVLSIPTAASVMDADAPNDTSLTTVGTTTTIAATLEDADGNGIDATVTIITTLGSLETAAGVCTDGGGDLRQSCTIDSDGNLDSTAVGAVVVTLVHGGVSGTATVTFLSGTLTDTATVTFVGTTDTVTTSVDNNYVLAGTTNNDVIITVTALDSQGSVVVGETTLNGTVSAPTTNGIIVTTDCGTTNSDGECTVVLEASATTALGEHTVEIDLGTTLKATVTLNVVGATDALTTDAPTSVAEGSTTEITITATDEDGNPAPDGTTVTVASTGNAIIIGTTVTMNDGSGTFELVATQGGGSAIIALSTTGVDTLLLSIAVGEAVAETPADETPSGATAFAAPPAGGLSPGVTGTTDFQALIDAQTFTVAAIWKLDITSQTFQSYIPGGLAIANTLTAIAATDIVFLKSE